MPTARLRLPSNTTPGSPSSPRRVCGPPCCSATSTAPAPRAARFTPIVGVDVEIGSTGGPALLPLTPEFEHAVLTVSGTPEVDGGPLRPGSLGYLGSGRSSLRLSADAPARLLVLGGEPFAEQIVMWWNFVARSGEEVAAARDRWQDGGFAAVPGSGARAARAGAAAHPARSRGRRALIATSMQPSRRG